MQGRLVREFKRFLDSIHGDQKGIGVIHGGDASTRSAIVQHIVNHRIGQTATVVVDGSGCTLSEFLSSTLAQLGYDLDSSSTDDSLDLLRVVLSLFARTGAAPLLVVSNIDRTSPHVLRVLCHLAELRHGHRYALKMLFVDDWYYRRIFDSPAMKNVAARVAGSFELGFAEELPEIFISLRGSLVGTARLDSARTLIGRSDFCDIRIDSDSISRQHAIILIRHGAVVLMDLRSRHGLHVNSKKVAAAVLRDSDIIEIGEHRLKVWLPANYRLQVEPAIDASDTSTMQTLEAARQNRRRKGWRRSATSHDSG